MRRVAVTGLGVVSPLGNSTPEFFSNLIAGRSGVRRLDADFVERLSTRIAAPAAFDGSAWFPPPKLRMLDRVAQFALAAAAQAVAEADLQLNALQRRMPACFWAPA